MAVVRRGFAAVGVAVDEGAHFVALCEERRFVARQRRQVAQQRLFHAECCQPVRSHAHGFEQLVPALPARIGETFAAHLQRIEQQQPVFARDGAHPFAVLRVVEDFAEQAAQEVAVHRRRQHAAEQPAAQTAEEALVGQHAGFGIQRAVHARGQHRVQMLCECGGQFGAGAQQPEQRTEARFGHFMGFASGGPDQRDQPGQRFAAAVAAVAGQVFEQSRQFGDVGAVCRHGRNRC